MSKRDVKGTTMMNIMNRVRDRTIRGEDIRKLLHGGIGLLLHVHVRSGQVESELFSDD